MEKIPLFENETEQKKFNIGDPVIITEGQFEGSECIFKGYFEEVRKTTKNRFYWKYGKKGCVVQLEDTDTLIIVSSDHIERAI